MLINAVSSRLKLYTMSLLAEYFLIFLNRDSAGSLLLSRNKGSVQTIYKIIFHNIIA